VELKEFFRQRESVVFTLLFPVILLAVFGAVLDYDLGSGVTFAWVAALGSASCTLLGIAVSSLAKNGRSASAMVTPIALVLQFISGVFFQFSQVPTWMQTIAAFFPLKWMAQGLRSVFLPDELMAAEPAGSWELGKVALVLALWCVGGLVLCVATFRWQERGAR
jgi:ABC-2 type transport system permease protein